MKILYFAPIPYNALKQRPQFLAEQLAKQHEVYYVEPTISILKSITSHNYDYKSHTYRVTPHLKVLRLSGLFMAYRSLELFDILHLNTVSERLQLHRIATDCDLLWVGYPVWYNLVRGIRNKTVVYDKMDDNALITQNSLLRKFILHTEPKLIRKASCVFVTAQKFYEEIQSQNKNTVLLPNAVSSDMFLQTKTNNNSGKRVFGYVGTIGHWFDFKAIQMILAADERNHVVLAGPCEQKKINHPRLTYLGTVSHDKIPKVIQSFDIALYPFLQNDLLDTIDPVKIYEYLALNKPVLAVKSRETEKFGRFVSMYENEEDLKTFSCRDFQVPFDTEEKRIRFVNENCWKARADQITACFQKLSKANTQR